MRPVLRARIGAIDHDEAFVTTDSAIAGFRRAEMPTRWHHLLKHPNVNRVVAKLIERDGSPADTPLPTVNRLSWPPGVGAAE